MADEILDEVKILKERLVATRRDLHMHPELGFQEVRTAGIVAKELAGLGLEVRSGVGRTGVVGLIEGAKPGPVTLLRFDMDALPVQEQTGAEYASQTAGVMHACGHDGHVAVGLAVARMLAGRRADLAGTLKFVFQPAEEGQGGAQAMLADGVLENPRPDRALALHLWNELPVGTLAINPGALMAGADRFSIYLEGKGGHGALPNQSVDPVLAAAQVVSALQSVVSRNLSPLEAGVVSVTTLRAGDAWNVIPGSAEIAGTVRAFEPQVRERILQRIEAIARGVGEGLGCRVMIDLDEVTPAVINDPRTAHRLQKLAARDFPDLKADLAFRTMVSEDMAYMLQSVPGVYLMIGSANTEKGLDVGHHHPRFDFDEEALVVAAAFMAAAALELQKEDDDEP
jgi:amidohydrolase